MKGNKKDLEDFQKAGEIAQKALNYALKITKPREFVLKICELVEFFIRKEGGEPAFPLNISLNEIAAHYTALPGDESIIPSNAIVKLDLGVHINGAIVDIAETKIIGSNKRAQEALRVLDEIFEGLRDILHDGVKLSQIGEYIWRKAHEASFGIVRDLCGHQIERWKLHAGLSIPNIPVKSHAKLREGMIVAIEPFLVLTDEDVETFPNYRYAGIFSLRSQVNNGFWKKLWNERMSLPFALRWIPARERRFLIFLLRTNKVNAYPALITKYPVVQKEKTFLVLRNSCKVLGED